MDWNWINSITETFLSRGYLSKDSLDNSSTVKSAIIARCNFIVDKAENILGKDLPLIREGFKKGWVSPSSPVWANFGLSRGLPVSCNGSHMSDNMESILRANAEIGMMTKQGAGTSCYMGELRPNGHPISDGGKSQGAVHFARLLQETISVISQSNVRRGACAIYLDIDHPDIDDWLMMRSITDGLHHAIQHLSFGVCISDKWFNEMLNEGKGGEKRLRIVKLINRRRASGYPYIFFTDNVNKVRPQVLKDKEIKINSSNLCSEIMLPATDDYSFVCNLASVNLLHYDDWKDTNFIQEMIYFLDAVLSEYIEKTKDIPFMDRAHKFAKDWRAIGLGTLGYHSYLQSKMVPFESEEARKINIDMHKTIQEQSIVASQLMAKEYGEPEQMIGYGQRHLCLNAIAPTTSSSIILGQVSPSIEPWESNYFENDSAKTVFTQKNHFLEKLLIEKGKNTEDVWISILKRGGSVQHLDFLSDYEKSVFKTFIEIDQFEIIHQAGDRQKYIDQGQSLNLKIDPKQDKKYNVDIIIKAWRDGLKSLYYHKGTNAAQELSKENYCKSCEA